MRLAMLALPPVPMNTPQTLPAWQCAQPSRSCVSSSYKPSQSLHLFCCIVFGEWIQPPAKLAEGYSIPCNLVKPSNLKLIQPVVNKKTTRHSPRRFTICYFPILLIPSSTCHPSPDRVAG